MRTHVCVGGRVIVKTVGWGFVLCFHASLRSQSNHAGIYNTCGLTLQTKTARLSITYKVNKDG